VDWQNLRLSLASARRRAGPIWVLQALVEEVRQVVPDTGPEFGTVVWLFLTPGAEHRTDRVLLETAALEDSSVSVMVRCVDGDLLGIEFALRAADAWHGYQDATIAIVTDAGSLASVARHFEHGPERRAPWLLHLHERPPARQGRSERLAVAHRLRLQLDQPAPPRDWHNWDRRAWALRRLAGRADPTPARRSLRAERGSGGRDHWHEADLRTGVALEELELADHLVAGLWRIGWGAPFDRGRAEAEAVRLGIEEGEASAAVDALLVAQLLRWRDAEQLEVPSGWREGLLLPMRRVVLRLARQDGMNWRLDRLVQQHRRCFLKPPTAAAAGQRHHRMEHESRVESWRWVRWALLEHLGAVEEQPDWRAGGSRWVLAQPRSRVDFAADTVKVARKVWRRLADPVPVGRLEVALETEDRVVGPTRWLRCLRDVGLVWRRGDRWGWDERAELHLPRGY
jgi:hypothetical protein